MRNFVKKIKLGIYYTFICRLPHTRNSVFLSHFRRWYVSRVLGVMVGDKESEIQPNVYLGNGEHVRIGRYCRINENVFIQGAQIGDFVMIAPDVAILSKSHKFEKTDIPMVMQGESEPAPPVLMDDIWIGRGAVIMPGTRIGRGSIVGAGAVVVKDVEPWSVVAGVPAKLIRKRKNV